MDIVALKKQIKQNDLSNFYIFCGPEIGLQNIYISQMSRGTHQRIDTIASVWNKLTSGSKLFKKQDKGIYVVRDDTDFMKDEKAWSKVSAIRNATLILLITEVDKRSKFYKHFKDDMIPFNKMTTKQLLPTVKKMIQGTDNDISYFIERCNNDYSTILNQLDKVNRLGKEVMTKALCDELIPKELEADVFSMVTSLIRKDSYATLHQLFTLLRQGQNELGILSVIGTKLQQCILVEGYRGNNNISQATGLNGWVCKDILDNNKLQPSSLLTALRLVYQFDSGIKSGLYEPDLAVENCILEILSLA